MSPYGGITQPRLKCILGIYRSSFQPCAMQDCAALPAKPYEFTHFKKVRVNINYHVEYDHHYYSVPYAFINRSAEVCATEQTVTIFISNKRVASHVRSRQKNHQTTADEHRPRSHQQYAQWNPERLVARAHKLGPHTATVAHEIMQRRQHPDQGFRSVLGLLRLRDKYADSRIEQACTRAVRYGTFSRKSVLAILRNNLDQQQDSRGLSLRKTICHLRTAE